MTYESHHSGSTRSVLWRLTRERYTPTPMPRWAGPVWSLLLALMSVIIGGDLIRSGRSGEATAERLSYVEMVGVEAAGWLMVGGAGFVVAAFLSRSLAAVILTHMAGAAIWTWLGIAYIQGQLVSDTWAGTRVSAALMVGAVMWAVRTGILAGDFYRPRPTTDTTRG